MLKPQDILALVGLQTLRNQGVVGVTLPQLAACIHLSGAETHAALARLERSQLLTAASPGQRTPNVANFLEFAEHGLRYVFPAEFGAPTRGLPTAAAAVPGLAAPAMPQVWPMEQAEGYGTALVPLYRSVPDACATNRALHVAMAALDCLRVGRPRERQVGLAVLKELFSS